MASLPPSLRSAPLRAMWPVTSRATHPSMRNCGQRSVGVEGPTNRMISLVYKYHRLSVGHSAGAVRVRGRRLAAMTF